MLKLCFVVFIGRMIDVSIGTIRTIYTVKGKLKLSFLCGFIEALLYFVVVRSALIADIKSILVPLVYAGGYATGSLLGTYISNTFINGFIAVSIVTFKNNYNLILNARENGYGVSVIKLNNDYDKKQKEMLLFELRKKDLKGLISIIKKYDKKAFIIINETKLVQNGFVK